MHFLTYVVIEREGLTAEYDLDIHDIQSAVEELIMPEQGRMFDYYEIGGRWASAYPDSRITVKDFLALPEFIMPCVYFDHRGYTYDEDQYIGLPRLMGWEYNEPIYLDIVSRIKARMLEAIKQCHPDDLIIIVDLHN